MNTGRGVHTEVEYSAHTKYIHSVKVHSMRCKRLGPLWARGNYKVGIVLLFFYPTSNISKRPKTDRWKMVQCMLLPRLAVLGFRIQHLVFEPVFFRLDATRYRHIPLVKNDILVAGGGR